MTTDPDPEEELALRLAAYRMSVQDPDVFKIPAVTENEREEARRITNDIRSLVRLEKLSLAFRLVTHGLAWAAAGAVLSIVFGTVFDVPLLVMVGGVCTLIGLVIMLCALGVQHVQDRKARARMKAMLSGVRR